MATPSQLAPNYRFGAFDLDPYSGELRRNGTKLKLQEQPLQVLLKLLESPGTLVTREELHSALWPADTFVDFDTGLNSAIKRLREVLGDSADVPRFIETVPRRGYRFIAPLTGVQPQKVTVIAATAEKPVAVLSTARIAGAAMALLLAAGAGALVVWLRSPLPAPQILGSTQITSDGFIKDNLRTDGKSLFFNERRGTLYSTFQVPSTGGSLSVLDSSPGFVLTDISSDGSKLIYAPHHKMAGQHPPIR